VSKDLLQDLLPPIGTEFEGYRLTSWYIDWVWDYMPDKNIRAVPFWEPIMTDFDIRVFKESDGGVYLYDQTITISAYTGTFVPERNIFSYGIEGVSGNDYEPAGLGESTYIGGSYWSGAYITYNGSYDFYVKRKMQTVRFEHVYTPEGA
jgi:hypothetical protein